MTEKLKRKAGRPTKAAEGKRVMFHVSLSPRAIETLNELCKRPIAPLEKSALIEHMIMNHAYLSSVERKARHGCIDMNCKECDK